MIEKAKSSDPDAARIALEELARIYLPPVVRHACVIAFGETDAEAAAQVVLARVFGEGIDASAPVPSRLRLFQRQPDSKFRDWLKEWVRNELSSERQKSVAKKRGGGLHREELSEQTAQVDGQVDYAVDVAVALQVHSRVRERLVENEVHAALWAYVASVDRDTTGDEQLAAKLGISENNLRVTLSRLRKAYPPAFHEEVAETLDREHADREAAYLLDLVIRALECGASSRVS
ncbi:MAG: sigma-70 family RNA polymerase sigma factor [Verrucomicrobiales bacterium]|nr:sigma-70 family RNA polymerase sigma factor [Verrucomicrobiales bacterium]